MQPFLTLFRLLLTASLTVTFACRLTAQQASTTQFQDQDPLAGDERLTQRAAIRAEGLPVTELLALLTKKTGIDLTTQDDIGDEKVVLFSPARPLRTTLADLAALFNNQWLHIEKPGEKPRYKLIRTALARAYEDSFLEGPRQRMMAQLEEQVRALEETPDQLKQRPDKDVIRASLLSPERRLATQFYALLTPEQKEQLFATGTGPSVSFSALPSEQQEALRDWCAHHNELNQEITASEIEQPSVRFGANVSISRADVRLWVGQSATLPLRQVQDHPPHPLPSHGNPYTLKPVPAAASLPSAAQLARAAAEVNWIDRLHALAEETGRPVLCDLFRTASLDRRYYLDPPTLPAAPANSANRNLLLLDGLCEAYHRLWWVRGASLLLRTRTWYDQRQYEVSDRWIREANRRIQAHGGIPTYGDMYRLLELTPKQIQGLPRLQGIESGRTHFPMEDHVDYIHLQEAIRIVRDIHGGDDQPLPTIVSGHMVNSYVPPAGVVPYKQRNRDIVRYADLSEAAQQEVQNYVKLVAPAEIQNIGKFECYSYAELTGKFPPLTPAEQSEANRQIHIIQDSHSTPEEKEEAEKQSRERTMNYLRQPELPDESRIDLCIAWTVAPGHSIMIGGSSYLDIHTATAIVTLKIPEDRSDKTRIDLVK
jgi:hypothetical protein